MLKFAIIKIGIFYLLQNMHKYEKKMFSFRLPIGAIIHEYFISAVCVYLINTCYVI